MATTPTDADLSDDDLEEIVNSQFQESTDAPEPTDTGPAADEASDTPEAVQPDNAPTGDETPATDATAQPAPAAASAPAAPVGKPFQFKASGGVHTLPGALELPDGSVVIPPAAQADFRRELASGRELQANFKTFQRTSARELQAAKTQRTEKDAVADALSGMVAEVLGMNPDQRWEWANNLEARLPQLELEVQRQQLAADRKALEDLRRGPQLSEEEQREQVAEQVKGELNATFQYIESEPTFKALTATEKQKLRARYESNPNRLLRKAAQDDPEQGIKAGDTLFDPRELLEDIQLLVENRKPAPAVAAQAKNDARNADLKTNPIPPTVRSKAPTGTPKRDEAGRFTDRKAFKRDLMRDDDDD